MHDEHRSSDAGGSSTLVLQATRTVPGGVTAEGWDRAVQELRTFFGLNGVVTGSEGAREWWSTNPGSRGMVVHVRVDADERPTRVTIRQDGTPVRTITLIVGAGLFAFALFFAVLGLVAEAPTIEWGLALVMLLLAAAAGGAGLWGARVWADRQGQRIEEAAERVERALREGSEGGGGR